jgi:hypothetical protein
MSMKREPRIETITIENNTLRELESLLQSSNLTDKGRNDIIRKYAGGVCLTCGNIPTKKLIYDAGGAQLIERYCENCFKKWDKLEKKKLVY